MTVFVRKFGGRIFRAALRVSFFIICFPMLFMLEAVRPVRFSLMFTRRVGHLAGNTECFLRKHRAGLIDNSKHYILAGADPANEQLMKMLRRSAPKGVTICDSIWLARVVSALEPCLQKTRFWQSLYWDEAEYKLFNNVSTSLSFTDEERARGYAELEAMGIRRDDWFVCFHNRDSAYLRETQPQHLKLWNRTDYRNTPLDSLVPAMRLITERGGFALRMGAIVDQPLDDAGDPKIIDYANLYRSPFMDMFLAKHCRFFIGTASGALMMATVQDVPVISTNHVPYSHFHNHSYDMVLPRLVLDPETEETISYARAQELGFYSDSSPSSKAAQTLDYGWRENDVEDIRNACEDMLRYLDGEPVPAEIAELQTAFARKYLHALPDHDLAAKIAPSWAAKYAEYF